MHMQPVYKKMKSFSLENSFSVSENLFKSGICIPSGISLTDQEQYKIINLINEYFTS